MGVVYRALPFTFVVHALGIVGAVLVLFWSFYYGGGFAWNATLVFNIHPMLMLIGLVIVGGEAIIIYKALPLEKKTKKLVHLILHGVALVLAIIGISAAVTSHIDSSEDNVYSLHSWLGLLIVTTYAIQWIYGFFTFFYPDGSNRLRTESLPWHVVIGLSIYTFAVVNAVIGFVADIQYLQDYGLGVYDSQSLLVNFTALVTVMYGAFVVLSVLGQPEFPVEDRDFSGYSAIQKESVRLCTTI